MLIPHAVCTAHQSFHGIEVASKWRQCSHEGAITRSSTTTRELKGALGSTHDLISMSHSTLIILRISSDEVIKGTVPHPCVHITLSVDLQEVSVITKPLAASGNRVTRLHAADGGIHIGAHLSPAISHKHRLLSNPISLSNTSYRLEQVSRTYSGQSRSEVSSGHQSIDHIAHHHGRSHIGARHISQLLCL